MFMAFMLLKDISRCCQIKILIFNFCVKINFTFITIFTQSNINLQASVNILSTKTINYSIEKHILVFDIFFDKFSVSWVVLVSNIIRVDLRTFLLFYLKTLFYKGFLKFLMISVSILFQYIKYRKFYVVYFVIHAYRRPRLWSYEYVFFFFNYK